MKAFQLIEEIKQVFASVAYPGDDDLVTNPNPSKAQDMLRAFRGLHWHDITEEFAVTWCEELGHLTKDGFRFFVPGFTLPLLAKMPEELPKLEHYLIHALMPPDKGSDRGGEFYDRMSVFDAKQHAAIAKFVDYDFWYSPSFDNRERGKLITYWQSNAVLMEEIQAVFEDVTYPGDDNLIKNPEYAESFEMLQAFRGLHWREVTVDLAEYWYQNTGRFTDEGFHFFLPAFLYAALHEDSTNLSSYLIYEFIPVREPSEEQTAFRKRLDKRFDGLSEAQKAVVGKFVKLMIDENPSFFYQEVGEITRSFWGIS